jgi:hypothetical protein
MQVLFRFKMCCIDASEKLMNKNFPFPDRTESNLLLFSRVIKDWNVCYLLSRFCLRGMAFYQRRIEL